MAMMDGMQMQTHLDPRGNEFIHDHEDGEDFQHPSSEDGIESVVTSESSKTEYDTMDDSHRLTSFSSLLGDLFNQAEDEGFFASLGELDSRSNEPPSSAFGQQQRTLTNDPMFYLLLDDN